MKSNLPTVLITGASTGIGAAYAQRFARRGHPLVLVARNQARLEALATTLRGETGTQVEVLAADLTDRAQLARVERRLREDAQIGILVNNAGVGAVAPLLDSNVDQMEAMITLNVSALTRLTYAAAPGFAARGSGAIINIASVVAIGPEILNGVYGATKAFVLALSQSLQHELASKGVRIQAVLPGATATEFWDVAGLPVSNLPANIVMSTAALVDAALVGFDRGEVVTIPSLQDGEIWEAYEAQRRAMSQQFGNSVPGARYRAA